MALFARVVEMLVRLLCRRSYVCLFLFFSARMCILSFLLDKEKISEIPIEENIRIFCVSVCFFCVRPVLNCLT